MDFYKLTENTISESMENNIVMYDNVGMPSIMVKIPKQTYKSLGLGESLDTHPAWIVNGNEVDAIYISKYENIVISGKAYSLPEKEPETNINITNAMSACTSKGRGWHLITRSEVAALSLWCRVHGTAPKGNNYYGRDYDESGYFAIPKSFSDGKIQHVATGSGPLSWSHDSTESGIWDLNGNVSEFVCGFRTVNGEIQIIQNNDAADSNNDQQTSSVLWKAINASDGTLITPNGSGTTSGSIKLDYVSNPWRWQYDTTISNSSTTTRSCQFKKITCTSNIGNAAKIRLQELGLLKITDTSYDDDSVWFNNGVEERLSAFGGSFGQASAAGINMMDTVTRTNKSIYTGFRAAYINLG